MHIILCLDQKDGMLFHRRRQSRDCKVIENIFSSLSGQKLCIQPFSEKLFENWTDSICVTENFEEDATCFLELPPSASLLSKAVQLTIYRWDKVYPADQKLTTPLSEWVLQKTETFTGKSHAVITKEVYTK